MKCKQCHLGCYYSYSLLLCTHTIVNMHKSGRPYICSPLFTIRLKITFFLRLSLAVSRDNCVVIIQIDNRLR